MRDLSGLAWPGLGGANTENHCSLQMQYQWPWSAATRIQVASFSGPPPEFNILHPAAVGFHWLVCTRSRVRDQTVLSPVGLWRNSRGCMAKPLNWVNFNAARHFLFFGIHCTWHLQVLTFLAREILCRFDLAALNFTWMVSRFLGLEELVPARSIDFRESYNSSSSMSSSSSESPSSSSARPPARVLPARAKEAASLCCMSR